VVIVIRRLALIVAGVVTLAAIVAVVAAYVLLSGDGVRRGLETQATAWLGEPVRIGTASPALYPRVGVSLADVRVGEPVRISLSTVVLSTDLRALISRRIEDADVTIADSRIEMPIAFRASAGNAASSGAAVEVVSVRSIALRDMRLVSRGRELLVSADSSLQGDELIVNRFTAETGQTTLEASGTVALVPRVDAKLRVRANRLDVDELMALAEAFSPPAFSRSKVSAPAKPVRIAARVSAETARFGGVDVRQFASDMEVDGSSLAMSPLTFQLFGGRYQGALHATLGQQMRATVTSRLLDIDVAQLAAFGGVPGAVTGRLTGAGTFSGRGTDVGELLASARGDGTAVIVDGTIQRLNLIRTVVLFFGRPAPDAAPAADTFARMDVRFSLADQLLQANAFALQSRDADIVGSGQLNMADKTLKGELDLSLSEELSAQAGTDLRRYTREGNRIVLPARLGGTVGNPNVRIDAGAALQRGLRNEVQRRLGGLLDLWQTGSAPVRDPRGK
jgi:uncharacterized protein involved in outer membrane biogenesis